MIPGCRRLSSERHYEYVVRIVRTLIVVQILVGTDDVLRIETIHPSLSAQVNVNYEITIFFDLPVNTIESSNGGISIQGAKETVSITTPNGPISVKAFTGDIAAHTSNGAIEIADTNGVISASISNRTDHFAECECDYIN